MAGELCVLPSLQYFLAHRQSSVGWARGLGYSQASHNPRFREFRRLFNQFIGPRACANPALLQIQERENIKYANVTVCHLDSEQNLHRTQVFEPAAQRSGKFRVACKGVSFVAPMILLNDLLSLSRRPKNLLSFRLLF